MILVCLIGKSGSGKSEIERKLEKLGYNRIISYTTRQPRPGEESGVHYHFVNDSQFKQLIDKDILMEHASYGGNQYGSPRPVGSLNNVIVVEPDGYNQIRKIYGRQVVGVYVDVNTEETKKRALKRLDKPTDKDIKEIEKREKEDNILFKSIENTVDLIVDGTRSVELSVAEILKFISNLKKGMIRNENM